MKERLIRGCALVLGAIVLTVASSGCLVVGRRHHYRRHVTVVEPAPAIVVR